MNRLARFGFVRDLATGWDVLALILIIGFIAFLGEAARGVLAPLADINSVPMSIDPVRLPEYAVRTTLRMLVALGVSLVFTLTYATWAAKSERAGRLLVPILDILQSVPILGFISITVVFFMSLAPGRVLGAEFAAIFAIFTSQAWNMAFSFYQSLRTVPAELAEAAASFRLSPWMRFWRLEVPFATPALIWNMMMSMSGGWFFVVAAESISVGQTTVALPGIGSYIALAIAQRDLTAIVWAIATMLVVIAVYDQLLFRPLIAWADRFRVEEEPGGPPPRSWALKMLRLARPISALARAFQLAANIVGRASPQRVSAVAREPGRFSVVQWLPFALLVSCVLLALWHIGRLLVVSTSPHEVLAVTWLAVLTMTRVFVLISLASLLWVPVGIWVGLHPRTARIVQPIAQFLAAFPANLLFPVAVYGIVTWKLDPDVWLSPLMILGTQWYILFNVIAGASAMPGELRYAASNFGVRGWLWWRKVALPGVLPYYVTGAITASGGSWNAAIVAELANWGRLRVQAHGLGAYIADATVAGDFHRIVLGIATMSLFVLAINRFFWRPLYYYAERRYRLT